MTLLVRSALAAALAIAAVIAAIFVVKIALALATLALIALVAVAIFRAARSYALHGAIPTRGRLRRIGRGVRRFRG